MNLSGYRRWSKTCFDKFGETPYALVKCVDGQNTIEMQDITFSLIYCFWKWIGENFYPELTNYTSQVFLAL